MELPLSYPFAVATLASSRHTFRGQLVFSSAALENYKRNNPEIPARHEILQLVQLGDIAGAFEVLTRVSPRPSDAPGLWELMARQCEAHGAAHLAHQLYNTLWTSGIRSPQAAVNLAEEALRQGDTKEAARYLEQYFGGLPADATAQLLFSRILVERDPAGAGHVLRGVSVANARDAVFLVDVLRTNDRLQEALKNCRRFGERYRGDTRFALRAARILEAMGHWEKALNEWEQLEVVLGQDAWLPILRLLLKLERHLEAYDYALRLLTRDDSQLVNKVNACLALDQHVQLRVMLKDAHDAAMSGSVRMDWKATCSALLGAGRLGTVAWLRAHGAEVAPPTSAVLDSRSVKSAIEKVEAQRFGEAYQLESPEILIPGLFHIAEEPWESYGLEGVLSTDLTSRRILLVNATLAAGGAERQFVILAQALIESGLPKQNVSCALFSISPDRQHDHFLSEVRDLGIKVHDLSRRRRTNRLDAAGELAAACPALLREDVLRLDDLVRSLQPHILHGWQDRASVAAGWVGIARGVPRVVMSARNMQPSKRGQMQRYTKPMLKAFLSSPRVTLTANSVAGSRDYESWLEQESGTVRVLRNALPTLEPVRGPVKSRLHGRSSDRLTVGGVFRLAANKRPHLWLRTVASLKRQIDTPIKVKICGTGPLQEQLARAAQEEGLEDFRICTGLTDVAEIYANMDILLLMSRVEGLPNVLLEAQSLGLPVAACDVGGVREAVHPDPSASLLLPEDVTPQDAASQLAAWLPEALALDPRKRQEFVANTFSLQALSKACCQFYAPPIDPT